ncbi:DMT family transporter [Sedimentimonas flavescens]|uniref:DMT family transporter n=1 Tax=Sedimentimonas flavescens TaxID=2851012 RepID=A0ABT2ZX18_9RHOB|nr:EamA family transporter [Sedimentimonas flavescens]MBW0158818.1 DMT family transporter [Sedimentimonas flavescens]MCT2540174.1 DMT family transporter [Sedimentimonas flavescens]MCV2878203.1 DMT family transporter [Sedimentimonas flavescens]WBL33956.1 EamA family transporter [Sinirhodobacter sp. HNIBRBA609]
MSEWLTSLEGTPAGHQAALVLALMAALLHALFGALQKGRHDPWLSRAVIDACYGLIAAPFALFVVPWPEPHMWPIFAGVFVIHAGYKLAQAMTYSRGAYTVVYPVVRGTGPLFAVIGAGFLFDEHFNAGQWVGVGVLVAGIYGLALYNLRTITLNRETMIPALGFAVLTGGFVALYTTYDAYGIRATADPFTFLAWFFFIDGWFMPLLTLRRWRNVPSSEFVPLLKRGVIGAFVAYFSFGAIMMATRLDNVGQAAVLRETSTVFAALIGWLVLGEKVGPRRTALMALIAVGAVIVEVAG